MPTIQQDDFADQCVTFGLLYGVNAHYVMAVAMLRSKLNDDVVGGQNGPYLWTQAEWDANPDIKNPALGNPFVSGDLSDWRAQVDVFVLMTLRQFTALQATLGQNPSALQLYQSQWPGESGPVVDNLQKSCDNTRQAILDAINQQLPEVGASSLAVTDPKEPVAQQTSNPPANLHTNMERNEWAAYHAALGAGLSDPACRALVANMRGESLGNPSDVHVDVDANNHPVHLARGIVQWDPPRSAAIKAHFGSLPNQMSVDDQTRAAIWEIQTNATYVKTKVAIFQSGGTAEQIIEVLVTDYERPARPDQEIPKRIAFLAEVAQVIGPAPITSAQTPGWIYAQKTGNMFHVENGAPVLKGSGYSGNGADENNPAAQFIPQHGPIPQGWYTIGPPQLFKNMVNCLPLTPDPSNNMGGRAGFLIHDGAFNNPLGHGNTSEGCICLPQIRRIEIWESGDHRLKVVADLPVSA